TDFSHANLTKAKFSNANMQQCVLHCVNDKGTDFKHANLIDAHYTDEDLAAAEQWAPPASTVIKA
ncbi:MAG: pentapeptide repeat-containing protein, partial [Gammaproteobacteria bacterium]|nr:pentapeptide repeat-containing protein [Gammaproteobacteria bacterium]